MNREVASDHCPQNDAMTNSNYDRATAPEPPTLLHSVAETLAEDPDRDAVVFDNATISYRELARRTLALADDLRQRGVKPGEHVAALVTPRPEGLISLLAVWLTGATWVGINTRYKLAEQRTILDDCGAKVLISVTRADNRDLTSDIRDHEAAGMQLIEIGPTLWDGDFPAPLDEADPTEAWRDALDRVTFNCPAVVIYTSGSTGRPKGALTTHAGLSFRAVTMVQDRFDNVRIRLLLDLPMNHIGALASGIGLVLASGGLLVMAEKFDPGYTLASIEAQRLNVVIGVPAMMTRIVEHPDFGTTDLTSLKYMCWGAGPISERVLDRFLEGTQARISQQYGMTETNGFIVYTPPTRDRDILLSTTGLPDPHLDLRIADDGDSEVRTGEEGEVQVKLPFPFAGYLNNPDATAEAFTADGFLKTGDLAKIRPDGYLVFCGRAKEMYKSGGFNVYPREVEIALEAHPSVRAAVVLSRDDAAWGQVGIAFVEPSDQLESGELSAWCKAQLADFKIPKAFHILDTLPRTTLGKVDKVALSNRIAAADNSAPEPSEDLV